MLNHYLFELHQCYLIRNSQKDFGLSSFGLFSFRLFVEPERDYRLYFVKTFFIRTFYVAPKSPRHLSTPILVSCDISSVLSMLFSN